MKTAARTVLAVVLLLAGSFEVAHAQFGFRGGYTLNDFFGDDVHGTQQTREISLGITAGLIRMGSFQIVAEGYYRKKGAGWDALDSYARSGPVALDPSEANAFFGEGEELQTLEFGIDYVEVPLLLRWNSPVLATRFRPYVNAGPAFAWRIDCGITVSGAAAGGAPSEAACDDLAQETIEDTLRQHETGLVVGGGVDMSVLGGAGALNLDLRLTRGLSRLQISEGGPDVRNQAFSVMLGYSFGF